MRNIAFAVAIVLGMYGIDQRYYHGAMLRPVFEVVQVAARHLRLAAMAPEAQNHSA